MICGFAEGFCNKTVQTLDLSAATPLAFFKSALFEDPCKWSLEASQLYYLTGSCTPWLASCCFYFSMLVPTPHPPPPHPPPPQHSKNRTLGRRGPFLLSFRSLLLGTECWPSQWESLFLWQSWLTVVVSDIYIKSSACLRVWTWMSLNSFLFPLFEIGM